MNRISTWIERRWLLGQKEQGKVFTLIIFASYRRVWHSSRIGRHRLCIIYLFTLSALACAACMLRVIQDGTKSPSSHVVRLEIHTSNTFIWMYIFERKEI